MLGLEKLLSLSLTLLMLTACSVTFWDASENTPEPTLGMETALAIAAATAEIPRPTPTPAALGTIENPLVLTLPPGSSADVERVEAGKAFAEQLSEVTGYTFVVVAPESYARLVDAIGKGNAHIAVLPDYAYALAYENGYVNAAFASLKSGEKAYGAQFIARKDAGFKSYFDTQTEENTADAATALSQFRDKKPCWSDETSPSGYVIPSGILAHNDISLRLPAFVQGQPTVVRAVYVGGICDFGATYIDARDFPAVLDEYPDALERVRVIWRIPPIIPYETFVIARTLPPEIVQALEDAMFRISGMQAGRQVLGQAYGIEEWERITDAFYEEFRLYLDASGVDLESLLN
ncbi:MAG: PhnD/SsuA/transferrin family substrate-binding protein [Anaerolineales bacterium]|nr:PhnD/SsuA/transferrin family substrate-binding protein [Anaerolineales bacterium]